MEGAIAAYEDAMDSGDDGIAPKAMVQLGIAFIRIGDVSWAITTDRAIKPELDILRTVHPLVGSDYEPHRFGDRRGITTAGQVALMTLGYRKVVIRIRKSAGLGYPCRVGQPSQGLRRAPQKPHNSATRRPIPTGIPRTKRHTPVHLLCVLKKRKIAGQQRRCA
jgi:hypothetical protein